MATLLQPSEAGVLSYTAGSRQLKFEFGGTNAGPAGDVLVEYFRAISGEHDDWDEYRQAMDDQGKCAIVITPTRWSPVSTGGFPPELFED